MAAVVMVVVESAVDMEVRLVVLALECLSVDYLDMVSVVIGVVDMEVMAADLAVDMEVMAVDLAVDFK